MLDCFAHSLFRWLRGRARELGTPGAEAGAVTFVQRFGSALQLNVHFHLLAPEGVFTEAGAFVPTPPPDDEEVRALLETFLHRLKALLERWDADALEALPQDALEALWWESARARPPAAKALPRRKRRCAEAEGFSLHANTHVHENDRKGLYTLCLYGARGPLALERLEEREDGRFAYRMKRPAPNGKSSPIPVVRFQA